MPEIIVSYAREDESRERRVVAALEERGCSVFWDRRIRSGERWPEVIEGAVKRADQTPEGVFDLGYRIHDSLAPQPRAERECARCRT